MPFRPALSALHYNESVGSRTGRSLVAPGSPARPLLTCWGGRETGGKSELRRAVCRITSGRAPALS